MIHSREVFPKSLDHALLANRVALVLDRIRSGEPAPDRDEALADAEGFLNFIVEGKDFTDRREVAENSYQAALAYGEAKKAIERLPNGKRKEADFDRELQRLRSSAAALREEKPVSSPDLTALWRFFTLVRDITLSSGPKRTEVVRFVE